MNQRLRRGMRPVRYVELGLLALAAAALAGIVVSARAAGAAEVPAAPQHQPTPPLASIDHPTPSPEQALASVEQLKSEAFKALRGGKFDRSNALLAQAAKLGSDPKLSQMASWTGEFESQRQVFQAERLKQYQKAVANVHNLLQHQKDDYAIDILARDAYGLSEDKKAFSQQPWVQALIAEASQRAANYETAEQWIKALRLYSDLASIEPANPLWKEKLKSPTRRLRLMSVYVPDELKSIQQAESKEREEVALLLNPATQPTTKPLADEDMDGDAFRIKWQEALRGIRLPMLKESLENANDQYYRDTSYRDLLLGGLKGLRTLATTKGLDQAFDGLKAPEKRKAFVDGVAEMIRVAEAGPAVGQNAAENLMDRVQKLNDTTVQLPEAVWVSEFADGAFGQLDPFSGMIWPADLEEFNKTTQGEFSGVGIQIQLDEADGSIHIVSPLEDSPAYKAKIKAGDIITHINGKNAKGISLNQAVKTITGPSGTTVRLTIKSPDGASRELALKRQTIKVASIKGWIHKPGGGWDYFLDPQQKIAYLRMTNFTRTTSEELDRAVDEMKAQGARAMILDLRYNPGGLLTAATEVCDKFLTEGTIVSTRPDRYVRGQSVQEVKAKEDGNEFGLPLVVLVNQYSASASEIVSGALKDDHRSLIVGERTFGKGSVQMLFPVSQHNAYLKLTTSHYYLPNGRCIHREENSTEWGVDPDVTVEMTPEQMRAAIDARQEQDILRDLEASPAESAQEKLNDKAAEVRDAVQQAQQAESSKHPEAKKKDPLGTDPQLSAALLLLRLQLNGAQL